MGKIRAAGSGFRSAVEKQIQALLPTRSASQFEAVSRYYPD